MTKERIGIFGCTADPFTLAHREIVKQVLKQNVGNAVIIVPTIVDWHRAGKTKWLDSTQKMTVAKALTKDLGLVYVDDTELCLKERCAGNPDLEAHAIRNWHFVDTLVRIILNRATDNQEFWPIVGSDELLNFKNWFAWRDILKLSDGIIAVVGRSGIGFDEKKFLKENPEFDGKLKTIKINEKFADTSASAIREKYKDKTPDEYIDDMNAEIRKNKTSHTEILLHTPIFNVVKGKKTETGLEPVLVNAPDWVTIIVESKGKFLVEKQLRYGSASIVEEFPCGMVEKGEDSLDAAVRELEEETGFKIVDKSKIVKLGQVNPNPAFMTNTMHYFYVDLNKVKYVKTKQKLDTHENIKFFFEDMDRFCQSTLHKATSGNGKVPALLVAAMTLYGIYKMDDGKNGKHA